MSKELFKQYIKYQDISIVKIRNLQNIDEYLFCYDKPCKLCKNSSCSNGMNRPTITVKELKELKEEYPELFI